MTQPVNDFANILDAATERELDRRIRALQAATGDVVAVATVQNLQPLGSLEEYAVRLFENGGRGIGAKGKDNGALILVAVQERQIRIEVGYDLEEFVTDGYAGETIQSFIRPEFQRGSYSRGVLAGTTRIINRVAERRGVALQDQPATQPARRPTGGGGRFGSGGFLLLLLFLILMSRGGRRRRNRRWGGGPWSGWNSGVGPFGGGMFGGGMGGFGGGGFGGGGGGFGGFGGGRSGGGGASGGW